MKKILYGTAAAIAMVAMSQAADAPQITFGASVADVTFTGLGPAGSLADGLSVSFPSITMSGFDNGGIGDPLGSVTITSDSFKTGAQRAGVFADQSPPTSTLTYTTGGNSLTETLTWTNVDDGSLNPHVDATSVITASSGSAAFTGLFKVGMKDSLDLITNSIAGNSCGVASLDALAVGTCAFGISISSGESLFSIIGVPEPGPLATIGAAMVGTWMLRRHRRAR